MSRLSPEHSAISEPLSDPTVAGLTRQPPDLDQPDSLTSAGRIYDDVTALIGHTPLVRLRRMPGADDAQVLAKLEFFNPAHSIKDRVALSIIEAAEASGQLRPGGTIIEATSGNTGIGLAFVGAVRGYHVVITMPESMSRERRGLMRAYGAEVVLTPAAQGIRGAVERAQQIVAATPGAVLADQFSNVANPDAHRHTTAAEIWQDTAGAVDVVIAGVGTGGTVTGIGSRLKELRSDIQIIGVEPAESPLLNGGVAGPHGIQGIGANFVPNVLEQDLLDEVIDVTTDDALRTARRAATAEGLLVGISAGAVLHAALEVAARPQMRGRTIVAVLASSGERYLSTPLYADLME